MDDLLSSIYTPPAAPSSSSPPPPPPPPPHPHSWKNMILDDNAATEAPAGDSHITLEAFLTKAGAVTENDVTALPQFPVVPVEASSSAASAMAGGGGGKGKRRAVEEPLDKATLQKQRRMIKNRESAARSRERKQAYTTELEFLVQQLETENARLLNEEADKKRQRFKELIECIIPVVEKRKPKRLLRTNSVQSL